MDGAESQAHALPPSMSASRRAAEPLVSSRPPGQSMRCARRSTRSWNRVTSSHAAAPPIGRFTQKIHDQSRYSANTPPSVGPMTDALAQTAAMYPWTLERSATE